MANLPENLLKSACESASVIGQIRARSARKELPIAKYSRSSIGRTCIVCSRCVEAARVPAPSPSSRPPKRDAFLRAGLPPPRRAPLPGPTEPLPFGTGPLLAPGAAHPPPARGEEENPLRGGYRPREAGIPPPPVRALVLTNTILGLMHFLDAKTKVDSRKSAIHCFQTRERVFGNLRKEEAGRALRPGGR